jgi:hypothetical protein
MKEASTMEQKGHKLRAWVVAIGVATGATLAGFGVAAAQTSGSDSTTTAPATQAAPEAGMRGPGGPGGPGGHHKGFGGPGIHGEFVTPKQGGGYQTIATQNGEVTAVSESSITVKSEDGYTKKYSIDDNNTNVSAGDDGTEDVKVGDQVHVMAIKDGDNYNAVEIHDQTQGERIGGQFRPAPPANSPAPAATPAA